jgi:glutathione S-transferase
MNARLNDQRFLAGAYSISDMACVGWIRRPAVRSCPVGYRSTNGQS